MSRYCFVGRLHNSNFSRFLWLFWMKIGLMLGAEVWFEDVSAWLGHGQVVHSEWVQKLPSVCWCIFLELMERSHLQIQYHTSVPFCPFGKRQCKSERRQWSVVQILIPCPLYKFNKTSCQKYSSLPTKSSIWSG